MTVVFEAGDLFLLGTFALVGYVYVGYPAILWLLTRFRDREVGKSEIEPTVTLIISAYNEEKVIARKLENSLELDYPRARLHIVVVSDASSDQTDPIVESYRDKDVTLLRMAERGGKTVGLNAAMMTIGSDIVIFSDANILYEKDAIRRMAANFADPVVGCVSGDSRYTNARNSAADVQETGYWGYERLIRSLESRLGSTVGGDGAILAIRRELYTPLPEDAINDFMTPLQIVARGYRAVFERAAVGLEEPAGGFSREFRRKRRIVNRSWRGLMGVPDVLNPRRVGLFAWQVVSHKVLRWLVLPLLLIGVIAAAVGVGSGWLGSLIAWSFLASVGLALLGTIVPEQSGSLARLTHVALYFYVANLAATVGIAAALAGRVEVTWRPERG